MDGSNKKQFGVVKFFNEKKGFGFITLETQYGTKDIFFHVSGVSGSTIDLKENQKVSFLVVKGKKGFEAQNVIVI